MHPAAASPIQLHQDDLTALPAAATATARKAVRFSHDRDHFDSPVEPFSSSSSDDSDVDSFSDDGSLDAASPAEYAPGVLRDETSWAGNLPAAQGLVRFMPLFGSFIGILTSSQTVRSRK